MHAQARRREEHVQRMHDFNQGAAAENERSGPYLRIFTRWINAHRWKRTRIRCYSPLQAEAGGTDQ
jgi:hypothetical protein